MSVPTSSPQIAVVVATKNRPELLMERSLQSILFQTCSPNIIILIDDSEPEVRAKNKRVLDSLNFEAAKVVYLRNARTPGASGCWNTAINYLAEETACSEQLFVALLDDDDRWNPSYLSRCLAKAQTDSLDMVAADLKRMESIGRPAQPQPGPSELVIDDFLIGNPGIQGSNLFVRLSIILAAGGFDEALSSCTDRDLCIRIAELGHCRFGRVTEALVEHFAEPSRPRLSQRGSLAKNAGLDTFWKKYSGRMSAEQRQRCVDRASRLFDWQPRKNLCNSLPAEQTPKKAIVLGFLIDGQSPDKLLEVLRQLTHWKDETLVGLDVVLQDTDMCPGILSKAAEIIREGGAGCFSFPRDRYSEYGSEPQSAPREESESKAQDRLVNYCRTIAKRRKGTEVWFVQDVNSIEDAPRSQGVDGVLLWLRAKPADLADRQSPKEPSQSLLSWIHNERVSTACRRITRRFGSRALRVLGSGSEAVVLTDGRTVYKCLDYWKTRMPEGQLEFLRSQVGRGG